VINITGKSVKGWLNKIMDEGYNLAELCLPCKRKYRMSRFSGVQTHEIRVKEANQNAKG
jgi:hypothetical protein